MIVEESSTIIEERKVVKAKAKGKRAKMVVGKAADREADKEVPVDL